MTAFWLNYPAKLQKDFLVLTNIQFMAQGILTVNYLCFVTNANRVRFFSAKSLSGDRISEQNWQMAVEKFSHRSVLYTVFERIIVFL